MADVGFKISDQDLRAASLEPPWYWGEDWEVLDEGQTGIFEAGQERDSLLRKPPRREARVRLARDRNQGRLSE